MRPPLSTRLQQRAAELGGAYVENHEPSHWLRTQLAEVGARLVAGQLDMCPQVRPHVDGFIALWASDWVACGWRACGHCESRLALTGDADRTCDRCSNVVDIVHPEVVLVGPNLLVAFALCSACRQREGE